MKVFGIGGGSGSGKSSVSYRLADLYPDTYEVINLDDYQKLRSDPELPKIGETVNWDHPDVIRWDDLKRDIATLKNGDQVHLQVWAHRSNPYYHIHGNMKPHVLQPKPIIIIEGYLALYPELIKIYDHTFYLDLDQTTRNQRRRDARNGKETIIGEPGYIEKVLNPMHDLFVEPTKNNAEVIIDVSNKTIDEIVSLVHSYIK